MPENNTEPSPIFGESRPKDKLIVEIPPDSTPMRYDKLPSGYDPMGQIEVEGRVFSGLSGGRMPWWILISGWVLFGSFTFLILAPMILTGVLQYLPTFLLSLLPLLILWKGTAAKLSIQKRQRSR